MLIKQSENKLKELEKMVVEKILKKQDQSIKEILEKLNDKKEHEEEEKNKQIVEQIKTMYENFKNDNREIKRDCKDCVSYIKELIELNGGRN